MKALLKSLAVLVVLSIGDKSSLGIMSAEAQTPPGVFVGIVAGERPVLATILIDRAAPGASNPRVRAYFCDGEQVTVWVEGASAGNTVDLTSKDGDWVQAQLADESVTGTVTQLDGRKFAFAAARAAGVSGLYEVEVAPDGRVHGTSIPGEKFEFRSTQGAGPHPGVVKFTLPDGKTQEVQMPAAAAEPGRYRLIALTDQAGALHMYGSGFPPGRRFYQSRQSRR
ncbi:MAG: hypothetical protein ACREC6_14140 [Hyphomicrobiaceae bacterium]